MNRSLSRRSASSACCSARSPFVCARVAVTTHLLSPHHAVSSRRGAHPARTGFETAEAARSAVEVDVLLEHAPVQRQLRAVVVAAVARTLERDPVDTGELGAQLVV